MFLKQEKPEMDDFEEDRKEKYLINVNILTNYFLQNFNGIFFSYSFALEHSMFLFFFGNKNCIF